MLLTYKDWRRCIRANAGVEASLTPDKVELFNQELVALFQTNYSTPELQVHHRVWVAIASLVYERLR
ncbi:MAG: hypothetical protein V7L20_15335 [Nostoc sp.]